MYDIIGLLGVTLIVITYLLLQLDKIDAKSSLYSILNIFGSLFVLISLIKNWNLSAFLIEFFWLLISFYGLYKVRKMTV